MTMDFDFDDEEVLDPRISIELEKLNSGTDEINSLEQELDRANTTFRLLLSRTSGELESLGKKIGSSIERARPFYEALACAQNAHKSCLLAAASFQRANGIHSQAKALVRQAELRNPKVLDSAWQEVLNHATMKVMEAEDLKKSSEAEHRRMAEDFTRAEKQVHEHESRLGRDIQKSRSYFELKDRFNSDLQSVKTEIETLQESIGKAKRTYASSLRALESISEEIHQQRRQRTRFQDSSSNSYSSSPSLSSFSSGGGGGSNY